MKKIDKEKVFNTTPKIAGIPMLIGLLLLYLDISVIGFFISGGLGLVIMFVGLIISSENSSQVFTRVLLCAGLLICVVGIALFVLGDSSVDYSGQECQYCLGGGCQFCDYVGSRLHMETTYAAIKTIGVIVAILGGGMFAWGLKRVLKK